MRTEEEEEYKTSLRVDKSFTKQKVYNQIARKKKVDRTHTVAVQHQPQTQRNEYVQREAYPYGQMYQRPASVL